METQKIILIEWQSGLSEYVAFNTAALYFLECHQHMIEVFTIIEPASLIEGEK